MKERERKKESNKERKKERNETKKGRFKFNMRNQENWKNVHEQ